jgi:hypothetical protein
VIGTQNEGSLHASLKEYYRQPGDICEGHVDGYLIDVIQPGRLVEIQTRNFSAIKGKLANLLQNHKVQLVHPITVRRHILRVAPETGEVLSRRKSPKRGSIYDLFAELVSIPHLLLHPNLTMEAALVVEEEIRCDDGQGSWRRRGVSIVDRLLVEVVETRTFHSGGDYLALLPEDLPTQFTNKDLAGSLGIAVPKARMVTYTLKHAGLIREVGKRGAEILHQVG